MNPGGASPHARLTALPLSSDRLPYALPSASADVSLFGGRRLIGRAAVKLIGEGTARSVAFVVTLWLARSLGEASFGLYSYALAAGFVIAQIADLGIKVLITREVAVGDRQATTLVRDGLCLKTFLSLPAMGMIVALAATHTRMVGLVVVALGSAMILVTFVDYGAYVFRGRGRIWEDVGLTSGYVLLSAMAVGGALILHGGLIAVSLATAVAAAVSVAIALWRMTSAGWLKRPLRSGTSRMKASLLWAAAPLGLATFASIAYTRLAFLLLEGMSGEVAVAHFSVAQRVMEAAQLLPSAAMTAVYPAYAALWRRPGKEATRLAVRAGAILAVAGLSTAVVLHLMAPWLIRVLFGEAYREGGPVLSVLAFAIPLMFVNALLLHLLIARGRQSVVTVLNVVVLGLHALLCWMLIADLGPVGAAASVLLSEFALLVGSAACIKLLKPAPGLLE